MSYDSKDQVSFHAFQNQTQVVPPKVVQRKSKFIIRLIETKVEEHEQKDKALKRGMKASITRRRNKVQELEDLAKSNDVLAYSTQTTTLPKARKELKEAEEKFAGLPKDIRRLKRDLALLSRELTEAEAREQARAATTSSGNVLRGASQTPSVGRSQSVSSMAPPSGKPGTMKTDTMKSLFGGGSKSKPPTIRREVVKVATGKRKATAISEASTTQKKRKIDSPSPPPATPARKTPEQTSGANKRKAPTPVDEDSNKRQKRYGTPPLSPSSSRKHHEKPGMVERESARSPSLEPGEIREETTEKAPTCPAMEGSAAATEEENGSKEQSGVEKAGEEASLKERSTEIDSSGKVSGSTDDSDSETNMNESKEKKKSENVSNKKETDEETDEAKPTGDQRTKEGSATEKSASEESIDEQGAAEKNPEANSSAETSDKEAPKKPTSKVMNALPATGTSRRSSNGRVEGQEGVAIKFTRKRSGSDDTDNSPPNKKSKTSRSGSKSIGNGSSSGSGSSGSAKPQTRSHLKGLTNHASACFANVVLQLFDAALEEQDLDALLVKLEKAESFGLSDDTIEMFDANEQMDAAADVKEKLWAIEKAFRAKIKTAAEAGEDKKVSTSKHLRSLLRKLRAEDGAKQVSPYVLQSVVAFGLREDTDRDASDLSDRQKMSGDTQEDCFAYYQEVLNALQADTSTRNAEKLNKLLEVETEERDICRRHDCPHRGEAHAVFDNHYDVFVPKDRGSESPTLKSLYAESTLSSKDGECPKSLRKSLSSSRKITKAGDNFVIKMNREHYDSASNRTSKAQTLVNLDMKEVEIQGSKYELTAVIVHKGRSINASHYVIFRKNGGSWFQINDEISRKVQAREVVTATAVASRRYFSSKK